jgi:hypothetical protein
MGALRRSAYDRGTIKDKDIWFKRGIEALGAIAPDLPRCYVCPLCLEGPIEFERLTFGHAPPESTGGEEIALTCYPCNEKGGRQLDQHAAIARRWQDFNEGIGARPLRAKLHRRQSTAVVDIDISYKADGGFSMAVIDTAVSREHQKTIQSTLEEAPRGSDHPTFGVAFHSATHSPRRARLSMLRAGYVALFARLGYLYVWRRELDVVRDQIRRPTEDLITNFYLYRPDQLHDARAILIIKEPDWLRSYAVQMGRHLVFLPRSGDHDLYTRIAEHLGRAQVGRQRLSSEANGHHEE